MTPYTLPIPDFCEYSGIGQTKARELIATGELQSAVIAGRRMVLISSYHEYVERCRANPQLDARRNKTGAVPPFASKPGKRDAATITVK